MRLKNKKTNKYYIGFIVTIVIIVFFVLLSIICSKVSKNVETYLNKVIDVNMYKYIFDTFDKKLLSDNIMNDFIIITSNDKGEIISVDYKLNEVYGFLSDSLDILYEKVRYNTIEDRYYDNEREVFLFPLGFVSDNYLFSGIGPVIPIEVNFFNDVHTGINTKVTNYGINYLLVEVYLQIEVISYFIAPTLEKDYSSSYDILIASKIISGSIPSYYGGVIEKSSSIVSS